MRLILILCSFLMFSCQEQAEKTPTKKPNPTAQPIQNTLPKAQNNLEAKSQKLGPYPTASAITDAEKPVMGGPADFKIIVKGTTLKNSDLIGFYLDQNIKIDSAPVAADGTIHFKNADGFPQGLYYVLFAKEKYLQIMLGENQQFTMETTLNNTDQDMVVKGSDENQALYDNIRFSMQDQAQFGSLSSQMQGLDQESAQYKALNTQLQSIADKRANYLQALYDKYPNSLFTKFQKSGANPTVRTDVPKEEIAYHYRQEFWNGTDFSDKRLLRTPVINNKLKRYFSELTPQHPDSIFRSATRLIDQVLDKPIYYKVFTNWVLLQYEPTESKVMDPEYINVKMLQRYFQRDRAFWLDSMTVYSFQRNAYEKAQSLIGDKGPDVISKNLKGETKRLMASTADYLIVYMFAPSCEHCQEETPKLVQWYNSKKGQSIDVYAIALDSNIDDPNELANYIKKTNMPFTCVWDPTNKSIYAKYYVDITPEIYVLSPDRTIIGKNLKVEQIDTIINRHKEEK